MPFVCRFISNCVGPKSSLAVIAVLLFGFPAIAMAETSELRILRLAPGLSMRAGLHEIDQTRIVDSIPQLGVIVVKGPSDALIAKTSKWRDIGRVGRVSVAPTFGYDDFGTWGIDVVEAPDAWGKSQGQGVVVAISDTGVDARHPELAGNMWKNPGETGLDSKGRSKASNALDDDANGYVDDVFGWNFVTGKPAFKDNQYHGTHVAGTIAARQGHRMSGIAPQAHLLVSAFLDGDGSGSDLNGAKSIVYAVDQGAKIINCSWGGDDKAQVIEDAIAYAAKKGVLVITAAGNDGRNTDKYPNYPSTIDLNNIVAVGATDTESGIRASYSNWGHKTVDLAAPGSDILSTEPGTGKSDRYQILSGTSMATPHVSGVAALIWSARPRANWVEVKKILLTTAKPSKNWKGDSVSGGVVNARLAVEAAAKP